MAYTDTINYITPDPALFERVEEMGAWPMQSDMRSVDRGSPVYSRARLDFHQSLYKYPAPPLYMGQRDPVFPAKEVYVLRLLIKRPKSKFFIPSGFLFLAGLILETAAYQRAHFPEYDDRFVYLTVRSGLVQSVHDDELHVDGFQGISIPRHIPEQSYIWSNCYPMHIALQPYFIEELDPGVHNVHTFFQQHTNPSSLYTVNAGGLYILDPYHVHARSPVPPGAYRSMVRVTYSPVEIRDDTNTPNPAIPMGPYNRSDIRNTLVAYEGNNLPSYGLTPYR